MKKITRILAAGLAAAMIVPMLTACKKGGGGDSISTDDPWYNVSTVEIGSEINYDEYDYSSLLYTGLYGENFVFRLNGSYKLPDGFNYETDDFNQYRVDNLRIYDMSGTLINIVDLVNLLYELPSDCDGGYIQEIKQDDQGYYVTLVGYSLTSSPDRLFMSRLDLEAGTFTDLEEISSSNEYVDRLVAQGLSQESTVTVGTYNIDKFWASGDVSSYVLEVTDENGAVTEYDMRALFPTVEVININSIVDIGNDKGIVIATGRGESIFFIIDFAAKTMTQDTSDMAWLMPKVNYLTFVEGLGTVVKDIDGIYTINYDNRTLDPLFLYTYANINMYQVMNYTPVTISEDRAIFSGSAYAPLPFVTPKTLMYVFDKADTNPNAGKAFIDVASASDYSYALCDAVCRFNETSEGYFIRFNSSYNIDTALSLAGSNGQDDSNTQKDKTATSLGNQLAIDIMSGTGPDIIINGQQFGMLNDDDYLLNLSSYVADNFGSDRYFTNVFEAAAEGEKLYQVPVSFNVMGIVTDSNNVDAGQIGFTFDQYTEFVSGPCNGSNPINQGRMYFFINSLNCMTDLVMADNTVEFDSEAFRSLAEYTAANINEVLQSDDDSEGFVDQTTVPASLNTIQNISSYFDTVKNGNKVMVGIPSYDGRGPIIVGSDSVAISAQTEAPDACRDFVSILLGDDVQTSYGLQSGIPVNRAAFASVGDAYRDYQNKRVESYTDYMNPADIRAMGMNPDPMDESVVSEFASFIDELTGWYTNDGSVNAIIREEMPAFFEGQKTLDQVVPVLEDRIQTLLNERG